MTDQPVIVDTNILYTGVESLPPDLWLDLAQVNPQAAAQRAGVSFDRENGYLLPFLGNDFRIHPEKRTIIPLNPERKASFEAGLVMLNYLVHAKTDGISGKMVSARELNGGELFFKGPHALSTEPVITRFAQDAKGLLARAEHLGATPRPGGDTGFRFWALPKVLVEYTFYEKDEEFPADLSITFDAYTDRHLPLDCIWAMVNIITHRLARA